MDETSERKAHVCIDCKARSPETDTNYTLISSRYGWRLSRHIASDGTFVVEWRCPRCWERHKRQKGITTLRDPKALGQTTTGPQPIVATPRPGPASRRSSSPPPLPDGANRKPKS
jgi:hypothetical protein